MRTTLTIDDELLAQAKLIAARTHTTIGSVVEDALRRLLEDAPQGRGERLVLPDFGYTGGLRAGVDLYDRDVMEDVLGDAADAVP